MRVLLAIYGQAVTIETDMRSLTLKYTPAVAAILLIFAIFQPVTASVAMASPPSAEKSAEEMALLEQLRNPVDGDWQDAEARLLDLWSQSGSAAMDLLLERGRSAIRAGKPKIAVEHLSALIDHDPDFAEAWYNRAIAWFMLGEYGLAVQDIARTLSLNPNHFGAMMRLGMIFEAVDQPEKALTIYRQALTVHPSRPEIQKAVKRLEGALRGEAL